MGRHTKEYLGADAFPARIYLLDRVIERMWLARQGIWPKYYVAGVCNAAEEEN